MTVRRVGAEADFGLRTLGAGSPLSATLLPSGAVYALRHGLTLINQVLPNPAEDGLFRLYVRERTSDGIAQCAAIVGAGLPFEADRAKATWWRPEVNATATLRLHPVLPAWCWCVEVQNQSQDERFYDVVLGQDVGLGDEAAVRNNEAYASQYLDFEPVYDESLGWTLLVRQNQPMQGGRHPWLGLACLEQAEAYATDALQFFGPDYRLSGEAAICRMAALPSRRLQYECAFAALQSRVVNVPARHTAQVQFIAIFVADHPARSSVADLALFRQAARAFGGDRPRPILVPPSTIGASIFVGAPWLHGDEATEADLAAWFPGVHRHVERGSDGRVMAFFGGDALHVALRAKEERLLRPHGHILRSGDYRWPDNEHFGVTAYAAGIFSAQSYLGNPSVARLLSVVRNSLNVVRSSGQRVFIRRRGSWHQLGIPSAFVVAPGEVKWIYKIGSELITARVWCDRDLAAAYLELCVDTGEPTEFFVTHALALGGNEFEQAGLLSVHPSASWVECRPDPGSYLATQSPALCFGIAAVGAPAEIGGDELLLANHASRGAAFVVVKSDPTRRFGVIQVGANTGAPPLPELIATVRSAFDATGRVASPTPLELALAGSQPGVARTNELLPWLNHNAAIHFSAPHGLEQYGGGAWGTRDVCQGSLEWLLTIGDWATAQRMLRTVFGRQYLGDERSEALNGTWPQWFMFPPFHGIQHAHSHGDICFWPVKALCDYIEASDDLAMMTSRIGYTDPTTFTPASVQEPLWVHCDRVMAHVESRFTPGTALVNYGDGDWDDTLQPVDPALRTRMVSTWTVALAYQTFAQLAGLCRRAGEASRCERLVGLLDCIRRDFATHLVRNGVVAGFVVADGNGGFEPLLHPADTRTGIHYRLLPMTRGILAGLLTAGEAKAHLGLIERELSYPDGVRLMSQPAPYHGGVSRLFKRAETAANVGREIGLQYVHAHLRYAEALATMGEAERFWQALQVVNPVALADVLANAAPRQSNVYFSSSDADFADRYEAAAHWHELRCGTVPVRGGWRLYSSGPGLFLRIVRSCLLGVRESFEHVLFDPVLPKSLDGLLARTRIGSQSLELRFRVKAATFGPARIIVGGAALPAERVSHPYRTGGLLVRSADLSARVDAAGNRLEIEL